MSPSLLAVLVWVAPMVPSAVTDADWHRLDAFSKSGYEAYQAGHYLRALEAFRKAEVLMGDRPAPLVKDLALTQWNIARCLEILERYDEAMIAFEKSAELWPDKASADTARQKAEEMRGHLFGDLTVTCDAEPAVTRVEIRDRDGGQRAPRACMSTWNDLPVGPYYVVGISDDGPRVERTVTVLGGRTATVRLHFPGALWVGGPEGLPVYIDDVPAGAVPARRDGVEPGRYRIRVEYPEGPPWTETVTVRPGRQVTAIAPTPLTVPPPPQMPLPAVQDDADLAAALPWIFGGGALAAGAIGGVFLYSGDATDADARRAYGRYRAEPFDGARIAAEREQVETLREAAQIDYTVGWIALGTATALAGAAVWTLVDPWQTPVGWLEFGAVPEGAQIMYRGAF